MIKSNKHIEIVRSSNKELSSMSQESCDSIVEVLTKHFTQVGVSIVDNSTDLEDLIISQPDLVFLGMEFIPSDISLGSTDPNKIWISDELDSHEIAYTGSSQVSHELERNKDLAKQCVLDAGLTTSAFCVLKKGQPIDAKNMPLEFPLFVKPANRGGGLGIDSASVVQDFRSLSAKVNSIINDLHSDVLIEEYLDGREFSVAILKEQYSDRFLVMPIELVAPVDENGNRLLSGNVKSSNAEQALEVHDVIIRSSVTTLALAAFLALGARDYGRIDIRLDKKGTPHFLEANLLPSLISGYGSFPKASVLNAGLDYEAMIMRIVELGLTRQFNEAPDVPNSLTVVT
jgi:D-alanine-D-alanine ligase